jgi:hypothetical protein
MFIQKYKKMLRPIDVLFDSELADDANNDYVSGTRDNPTFSIYPAISDVVGVCVMYANIPFTYYVIDSTNNKFTFTSDGDTAKIITIPPGTYNSLTIAATLTNIIKSTSSILEQTGSKGFYVYVDSSTGRLVFANELDTDEEAEADGFSFIFDQDESPHKVLGYDPNVLYTADYALNHRDDNDKIFIGYKVEGSRTVNLTGPAQMFLNSDFGSAIYGSVRNQTNFKALLGFWPVNANYQGTIEYSRENPVMIPMSKTTLSKISLSLTLGNRTRFSDADNNEADFLELNGEAFQVGLRFYVSDNEAQQTHDSLGNAVTTMTNINRQSVFNPKKLKRGNVVMN